MNQNTINKFETFLKESGAEVLRPTNEYELVRFRTCNGVSVVYTGRRGITFTGESEEAFEVFQKKDIWQIKRREQKERERLIKSVLDRDGSRCFYCGKETTKGTDRSIEHILSISHGGNNNPNNLAISCISCNDAAGNMSIVEKIRYRETVRQEDLS